MQHVLVAVGHHRPAPVPPPVADDVHLTGEERVGGPDDRADVEVVLPVLDRHVEVVPPGVEVGDDRLHRPVAVPVDHVPPVALGEQPRVVLVALGERPLPRADADLGLPVRHRVVRRPLLLGGIGLVHPTMLGVGRAPWVSTGRGGVQSRAAYATRASAWNANSSRHQLVLERPGRPGRAARSGPRRATASEATGRHAHSPDATRRTVHQPERAAQPASTGQDQDADQEHVEPGHVVPRRLPPVGLRDRPDAAMPHRAASTTTTPDAAQRCSPVMRASCRSRGLGAAG